MTDLASAWSELEATGRTPATLNARVIDGYAIEGRRAFVALDWSGCRHLLLPTAAGAQVGLDSRSGGIRISKRRLMDGDRLEPFIDVVCLKPHLDLLFDVVAREMTESVRPASLDQVPELCLDVLARWRELIARSSAAVDMSLVIGTWGELWFVREILRAGAKFDGMWIGPLKEPHDLRGGDGTELEVKTTLTRGPLLVEIHGVEQLAAPLHGALYLGVLRVARSPSGENLADLADSCVSLGAHRDDLQRLLAAIGLVPVPEEANELRLDVRDKRLYLVDSAFPKVTDASFLDGRMPAGVASLDYLLDLTGEPPTAVAGDEFERVIRAMGLPQ